MKASDIMTLGAATIGPDASLSQALRIMIDHRISALPVLDDNRQLLGIVTEGDFVRSGVLAIDELLSKGGMIGKRHWGLEQSVKLCHAIQ